MPNKFYCLNVSLPPATKRNKQDTKRSTFRFLLIASWVLCLISSELSIVSVKLTTGRNWYIWCVYELHTQFWFLFLMCLSVGLRNRMYCVANMYVENQPHEQNQQRCAVDDEIRHVWIIIHILVNDPLALNSCFLSVIFFEDRRKNCWQKYSLLYAWITYSETLLTGFFLSGLW